MCSMIGTMDNGISERSSPNVSQHTCQLSMVRRKQLQNLACGIAGRFSSRNNDLDGYWALGLLYAAADVAGTRTVSLDLVSKVAVPPFYHSTKLLSTYAQYMDEQLEKLNLTGHVFAARIDVEFNAEPPPYPKEFRITWGEHYIGKVSLTDDLGRVRSSSFHGWCGKHDASREHRSTRIWADYSSPGTLAE